METARAESTVGRLGWAVFAPAVFLSAFLVFQIQPLISKHILSWFGGTSAVWTTCLLVFQSLLFAGYLYAHLLGRMPFRLQAAIHLGLLLLASVISVLPTDAWKPRGDENPLGLIVVMLLATVGLPYFALSATGPLLQLWFWRSSPDRSPYPLYALSNAGSLIALVSYPFVFEPNLSTPQQAGFWRAGFVVFLLLCAGGALLVRRSGNADRPARPAAGTTISTDPNRMSLGPVLEKTLWVAWSACSVILFMAVTNQLTVNVASVPFLWILPLSLYLITFIVAFSGPRWYPRRLMGLLLVFSVAGLTYLLQLELDFVAGGGFRFGMAGQIAIAAAALFVMCLVCHGELYRLRPEPGRLTSFYLSIAFGGMLGGIVVGVAAPSVFVLYQELHLGLLLCCSLYLFVMLKDGASPLRVGPLRWAAMPLVLGVAGLAVTLSLQTTAMLSGSLDTRRSFFGLLRVFEVGRPGSPEHALQLFDGSVLHGYQVVRPELRRIPTVYYSKETGVGGVLIRYRRDRARRIGIVGLGVGTLAAYGRTVDYLRFYEINPDVIDLAKETFSYLSDTPSRWDIALGDARLKLEQEPDQNFDVLVLDAFSSDAIPVHLMTTEAFDVYERHLLEDGIIAIHISNDHLDLSPIVYRHAESRGFYALEVRNKSRSDQLTMAAVWMILTRDLDFIKELTVSLEPAQADGNVRLVNQPPEGHEGDRPWTDTYNNLFGILR